MIIEKIKCRCNKKQKCSALLHGEISILSCEKNCGLNCNK